MVLKTLGGLELDENTFKQSKPLLLLSYLCLEGPQEKRHLAELFWPQGANAIRNLNTVISRLKKVDASLITSEDPRLYTEVACDAIALQAALKQKEYEKATELYKGPLLEGFATQSLGIELEEWLYQKRESLAALAREALLHLAEAKAKEGDFKAAANQATDAYHLRFAPEPEAGDLERLYTLLQTDNHATAKEVLKELTSYGINVHLSQDEARAKLSRHDSSPQPNNLPQFPTTFVGRIEETSKLCERLGQSGTRLVSIIAQGGMGKTRLAVAVGHKLKEVDPNFRDGIYFVSFVSTPTAEQMVFTLGNALDFSFLGQGEPKAQLLTFLKAKAYLLILDNLEHLLAEVPFFNDILLAAPKTKILATSREALHLQAEHVFELSGLKVSEDATQANPLDAVRLFEQRAQMQQASFVLDKGNRQDVLDICQQLGGMPLAIELAASWLRVLPLTDIKQELQQSLDLLEAQNRDLPERHRSMRAVFDYSWHLLSEEEQLALRKLAVFQGGFTRQAAKDVTHVSLGILASLINKSFLNTTETGRYRRHPLVIQYSQEKFNEQPEEKEQLGAQHSRYFMNMLEEEGAALRGYERKKTLARVLEDLPNIKQAWYAASKRHQVDAIAESVTSLYFLLINRPREAAELFRFAIEQLIEQPSHLLAVGRLYSFQAHSQVVYAPPEETQALAQKGLRISRNCGDERGITIGLFALGGCMWYDDAEKAIAYLEEALIVARKTNSPFASLILTWLMISVRTRASYEETKSFFDEASKELNELGDPVGLTWGLVIQGSFLVFHNQTHEGKPLLEKALTLSQDLGLVNMQSAIYADLALTAHKLGNPLEDKRFSTLAVQVSRQISTPAMEVQGITGLGRASMSLGRFDEARTYIKQAIQLAFDESVDKFTMHALMWFGVLSSVEGDFEEATALLHFVLKAPSLEMRDQLEAEKYIRIAQTKLSTDRFELSSKRWKFWTLDEIVHKVLSM